MRIFAAARVLGFEAGAEPMSRANADSYDVVCLFILMQGYPLLNISVVPYENPIELISTENTIELKHNVRRGYISETLKNGFLSFKDPL